MAAGAKKKPKKPKKAISADEEKVLRERLEAEKESYRSSDKKQVKALTDYANRNTTLEKASLYLKPVALLDYYTPLVKIRIFSPTKEQSGYGEDVLFTSTFQASNGEALEMNNYVQSFSYEAGAGKQDINIKLIDTDLDFADTILMRFSRDFENGIYLEVEFGWSNKESGAGLIKDINGESKVVHFTSKIVCNLRDIDVDEDVSGKRSLTLVAHLFNNLPGKLSQVTPYNELGPMPIMTYQLIRFLALKKEEMYDILKTASQINASTAKEFTKEEGKTFNNKEIASVLGGSTEEYRRYIADFDGAKSNLKESDPRKKLLDDITKSLKSEGSNAGEVNKIEKLFNQETFKLLLRGDDTFAEKSEILVRKFSTIIRDIRVHPWACFKFLLQVMQQKFKENGMSVGSIIYNDFAGATDYKNSKFERNNFDVLAKEKAIVGWENSLERTKLHKDYKENKTLRLIGILPTDVSATPGTDWESLLNMCVSKCYIFAQKSFKLDASGDVEFSGHGKRAVPKTETQEELKKKYKEDDISTGIFKDAAGKYRKIESIKLNSFGTNKNNVLDILNGIILLNDAKTRQSVLSASEFDTHDPLTAGLRTEAKSKNESLKKVFLRVKNETDNEMYYVINIYNNKQGHLFDNNFAKQNIHQAYSYRFTTQKQYAGSFNPGLPSVKMINFPDVTSFRANLKGMLSLLQDTVSASRNLKLDVGSSAGGSNLRFVSSNNLAIKNKLESIETDLLRIHNLKEKTEENSKQLKELEAEETSLKKLLGSKLNEDDSTFAKYKYPIYINAKVPTSFIYGNGENNNDVAILKNNIVNFRRRLLISGSFQPEATLEIFGDPSFSQIINFGTALIYIRVYNPDGTDSMHTGIYRLNGFKHDISAGFFKTTLTLKKETMHENEKLKQELENIIYMDSVTREESWETIKEQESFKEAVKKKREELEKQLNSTVPKLSEAEKNKILNENSNIDFVLSNSIDATKKDEEFSKFNDGELVSTGGGKVGPFLDTKSAKNTINASHSVGISKKRGPGTSPKGKALVKLLKP